MSDAVSKSTNITSPDLENAKSRPSPLTVSEENLAALFRATTSSVEPEAEHLAEGSPPASVSNVNESSAGMREPHADRPQAVTNPPANIKESRLALFAAVKENRSAISRSSLTAATPLVHQPPTDKKNPTASQADQYEKLSASLPPKGPPIHGILPKSVSLLPAPVASIATPSRIGIVPGQTDHTRRTRLVIGLIIGAVIATGGASILSIRARASKAPRAAAPAPKDNVPLQPRAESPLQVRVELLGKNLIDVRWNPQSGSIAEARDGRLVIREHNQQPRILALNAEQLKTGHLTYQSAAESVEFDLEVVDRSGAITKESIMALQAPILSPEPVRTLPPSQLANTATPNVQNVPNLGLAAEVPQLSQPKIRTFIPPTAQHNSEQGALIDAPPTLTNGPVMPPEVGLAVPLAVILPPSKKDAAVAQQVHLESTIEAANLIKKVIPIYPRLAKSTGIQGTVRFTAHIGKDGRILNLKFTSGPPVLVDSASAAVKQWVYRPTLLNGEPVEVITQIDVSFTLNGNVH